MEESLNFNFETTDKSQEILTNEYTQYTSDLDFFEGSELAIDGQNENDITPIALDIEHSEAYNTSGSSDIFSVRKSAALENSALISESELDSDFVDEFTGENYGYETVLDQAESETVNHLREFSQDSNLNTKLEKVFGEEQNFELNQKILKDIAQEGSLSLITIEVLDSGVLEGADGAYAESTETIYLSDELLAQNQNNPDEITQVLLEEFGHHLDAQINDTDTPGDEGAIFADIVDPQLSLSAEELMAASVEDDYGVIYVDGLPLGVEYSSPAYPGYEMQFNSFFVSTKDENVEIWQEQLIALGYDLGEHGADGYFGEDTDAATRQFQRDQGLEDDGIVGSQSWAAAFPPEPEPESDDDLLGNAEPDSLYPEYSGEETESSELSSNMKAFLDTISYAEGTYSSDGYRIIFGGDKFESFEDHPRVQVPFGNTTSSAAGRYQFLGSTWDEVQSQLNLPDFSPESQDKGAVQLIKRREAYEDVEAGNFEEAIEAVNLEWASLPGSPYGQPTKSQEELQQVYETSLSKYENT